MDGYMIVLETPNGEMFYITIWFLVATDKFFFFFVESNKHFWEWN